MAAGPLVFALYSWLLVGGLSAQSPSSTDKTSSCLVVFDRHNHKTGGTTMRTLFQSLAATGRCYYWGYGPSENYWTGLMHVLENGGRPLGGTKPLRMCMELHFRVPYWAQSVPTLAAIRERARKAGTCKLLLVARVRDPLSFYLSFWRWTVMGRQLSGIQCAELRAERRSEEAEQQMSHRDGLHCPPGKGAPLWAQGFGSNFIEWVRRTPNLQSRLLLDAGTATCIEAPLRAYPPPLRDGVRRASCADQATAFKQRDLDELIAVLDAHDVVGTTEDFDTHLLLLQNLTGWSTDELAYTHETPRYRSMPRVFRGEELRGRALPTSHAMACANMSACAEAVRAVAPFDYAIWERYGVPFRARAVALLGGEGKVAARLAELQARKAALVAFANALNAAAWTPDAVADGARHGLGVIPRYFADTRARFSRPQYCVNSWIDLPALLPAGQQLALPAPAEPIRPRWPGDPIRQAGTPLEVTAARATRSDGDTACAPVPSALVRLVQANFAHQRPRSKHVPTTILAASDPRHTGAYARWAAAHAALVTAAGMPVRPPACDNPEMMGSSTRRLPNGRLVKPRFRCDLDPR